MRFTQRLIEGLECPAGQKDKLYFDDVQKGLAVRVTAGGSRSYLAQYTIAGAKRRVPLGAVGALPLSAAREAVQAIMGEVAKGCDPAADRKAAATAAKMKEAEAAFTLRRLVDDWERLHLEDRKDRYRHEATRALSVAFARHLDRPAAELTRKAVVQVLDGLPRAMAARTAAYGRASFAWAIKRGSVESSPFVQLPTVPTERRDRVLTDAELREVWIAADPATVFGAVVRTLLLTGQRREEVGGMSWDEISPDHATWTIPPARAKNGEAHGVPLAPAVRELLQARPRHAKSDAVFWGRIRKANGEDQVPGPFNGWSKSKERLDAVILKNRQDISKNGGIDPDTVLPMPEWRLHDLRRTMATGMQRLGVRLEVTEAVLNHISGSRGGIVGIYQRHNYFNEKRAALEAWANHVLMIVKDQKSAINVVSMKAKA